MKYQNLAEMFFSKREKYPDQIAYRYYSRGEWKSLTFREAAELTAKISGRLSALGIQRGDRIALISANRWEWVLTDYATMALGACLVPIYPSSSPAQISYILNDSAVKILIVEDHHQFEKVEKIKPDLTSVSHFFIIDHNESGPGSPWSSFSDLTTAGGEDIGYIKNEISQTKSNDDATIIYTSGTTGEPKGVILTHKNFLSNVEAVAQFFKCGPEDSFLSFLPLSHIFERTAGHYFTCYHATTVAFARSIDTIAEDILSIKPTLMVSVPRLYEKMYSRIIEAVESGPGLKRKLFYWAINTGRTYRKHLTSGKSISPWLKLMRRIAAILVFSKLQARFGGSLRFFISGGAPLSAEIGEFFAAAGVIILEGYGLTETSPGITFNRPEAFKFGTVGTPLPGVEVKIAADGEILSRGDNIMKGYLNKQEDTTDAIEPDGWFHTGDIGKFDDEGFLVITDRKKNIIVTAGGKNIAPQPIENSVVNSPYIEQVLVIGDKRRFCSALIVPARESLQSWADKEKINYDDYPALLKNKLIYQLIEKEIDQLTENFAQFERIQKFILLPEVLSQEAGELTPTLKIKRNIVEQKFIREIDKLYDMAQE